MELASPKKRAIYLVVILFLVVIGIGSREFSFIPKEVGDAIWAMMVFCLWRVILIRKSLTLCAILALITSYLDELEQLIKWEWLASIRTTTLGHLILGQGFNWEDLIAYTIGIGIIWMIARAFDK